MNSIAAVCMSAANPRGRRVIGLIAAVAALALALLAPSAASARVGGGFWGVSPQGGRPDSSDFNKMGAGDVGTFRLMFQWPQLNARPHRPYRWDIIDPLVRGAAENRIKILATFNGAPDWLPCNLSAKRCKVKAPVGSKKAERAWQRFVHAAAVRYGPGGRFWRAHPSLRDTGTPITRWQIWNEQNSITKFAPRPSAGKYGKLVKLAAHAIHRTDRGAKIILGGMFGTPHKPHSPSAWRFLNRLYDVRHIKGAFDAVASHPYASKVRGVRSQVQRLRRVVKRNHDRRTDAYVTEVGWGSAKDASPLTKGLQGQARMLKRAFRMFLQNRSKWNLEGVVWFSWRDHPDVCNSFCGSAGLHRRDLSPKPSWNAFRSFTN